MSATLAGAVAPILKIRAALRERTQRPAAPAANLVSITDALMLGWTDREVEIRREARASLVAVQEELADLHRLATALVDTAHHVSPLERLLVFTKIESARGLVRQAAFDLLALCSLALVLWTALVPDDSREDLIRAPRAARVRRVDHPAPREGATA